MIRPPRKAALLVCRVTVRGDRVRAEPGVYFWEPDRDAHARVVVAAESWCRWGAAVLPAVLSASAGGPIPVDLGEPAVDRLLDASKRGVSAALTAIGDEQFRTIGVRASSGRISLVAGQQDPPAGWWRSPLREITDLLRLHADLLAYALVRPGWDMSQALHRDGLADDWPARPHHEPWGPARHASRLTTSWHPTPLASNCSALASPNVSASPARRTQPLGGGRLLLETADLDPWFQAPFVADGPQARAPRHPGVLEHARHEFDPIRAHPRRFGRSGTPTRSNPAPETSPDGRPRASRCCSASRCSRYVLRPALGSAAVVPTLPGAGGSSSATFPLERCYSQTEVVSGPQSRVVLIRLRQAGANQDQQG